MKLKFRVGDNLPGLQIVLFVLASFFVRYKVVYNAETMLYLAMGVIPILYFLKFSRGLSINISIVFLFLLCLFFGSFNSGNLVNSLFVTLTKVVIFINFIYLCECSNWENKLIGIFNFLSLIFALLGVIEMINPSVINSINRVILPSDAYAFFQTTINRDIYVGIAPQTSYQAHFILPMLAFSFCSLILSKNKRVLYSICILICMTAMIITAKRLPLVASIISMTLCSLGGLLFHKERKGRIILISLIAMLVFLYVLISTSLGSYLVDRFNRTQGIDLNRVSFWNAALQLWRQNPVFGMGTNYYSQNSTASVHNTYLQILCENGIVGLTLFVLILIMPLSKVVKCILKAERLRYDEETIRLLFCSFFFQAFFISHAFTESVYANNIMFLPYVIYSAIPFSIDKNLDYAQRSHNE